MLNETDGRRNYSYGFDEDEATTDYAEEGFCFCFCDAGSKYGAETTRSRAWTTD